MSVKENFKNIKIYEATSACKTSNKLLLLEAGRTIFKADISLIHCY